MDRKSRPKIMLVGQMPPTKGGVTTFMLNLTTSYLNANFEFVPYTTTRPPKKNVIANWGYGAMFRGGLLRVLYGAVLTTWRLFIFPLVLVIKKIDLVQIQASDYQVFWESVAYALAARLVGRSVLFRIGGAFDLFHGSSSHIIKRLIAASLRVPQLVIVQSRFSYDYVREIDQTYEMIVLSNWTRASTLEVVRAPREDPMFMFIVGNEATRKGFEEVIEAAQLLDTAGCRARFHLVAMVPKLNERVKKLGLSNIVHVEGPLEHGRVLEIMRHSDVFLLPSHGEGFPNSLLEAMAAGMPSIVTPIAAVPEIVFDGGALIIPVGDAPALAAAIRQLTSDPALRRKLGDQARNSVICKYTAENVLPSLADAYWRLLR